MIHRWVQFHIAESGLTGNVREILDEVRLDLVVLLLRLDKVWVQLLQLLRMEPNAGFVRVDHAVRLVVA